jgi:predicted PurR-regulated permease PerM
MITSKTIANGILRAITVIVLTALLLYFLYQISSVLVYLIVALILTLLIGNPVLDFFTRRLKFNHIFATIATLFIFVIVISGFIMMFIPLILSQGQNLSLLNTGAIEQQTIQLVNQMFFRKSSY